MSSLVPAIDRAIQVLYLFKNSEKKEYGVSEISRLLDLNKSTVHNILNTLSHHRFLVQNETTRRYRLGPALSELGGLVQSQIDVREIARPYLRRLMEQTEATILLGTFEGRHITIVDKEEPFTHLRVTASIGMQLPFCAGSFGKVFLAYLPAATIDQLLTGSGLRSFTPTSIINPDQYRAALAAVRSQGYAIDDNEEYLEDVKAISVPIFTIHTSSPVSESNKHNRSVAAAITLVNFSSRLSPQKIVQFTPLLVEAGQKISEELGIKLKYHSQNIWRNNDK
jgi:DNA-binding IclR family transcriptional regulator